MTILHSLAIIRGDFHKLDVSDGKYENPEDVLLIRAQHDFQALAAYLDIVQHHLNELVDGEPEKCHAGIQKTLDMARHYITAE